MGNSSSIFSSSVGKANLSPSSLRRLDIRSNGSSSIYVGGSERTIVSQIHFLPMFWAESTTSVRCFVFQCLDSDCFCCAVPPPPWWAWAVGTCWRSSSAIIAALDTTALVVGRCSVQMIMCVNIFTSVIPLPGYLSTEEEQWQIRRVVDDLLVLRASFCCRQCGSQEGRNKREIYHSFWLQIIIRSQC